MELRGKKNVSEVDDTIKKQTGCDLKDPGVGLLSWFPVASGT